MSGPEWHFESDGRGGFHAYNVGQARRDANALHLLGILLALFAVYAAVAALYQFALPFLLDLGRSLIVLSPVLVLLGLVQYPIVRVVDKIRGVRYPDHRFLRRWFKVSYALLAVLVIMFLVILGVASPKLLLHPRYVAGSLYLAAHFLWVHLPGALGRAF